MRTYLKDGKIFDGEIDTTGISSTPRATTRRAWT